MNVGGKKKKEKDVSGWGGGPCSATTLPVPLAAVAFGTGGFVGAWHDTSRSEWKCSPNFPWHG